MQSQLPPLSEAQIRKGTNAETFARGANYYQRDAVGPLVLRGDMLQAEVEGSESEPYRVTVSLDAGGVRAAACTCSHNRGAWCKHIVAALLAYVYAAPDTVEMRPPLTELLAGLDRSQLEDLLLRLAAQDADLIERINALISVPAAPEALSASSPRRRTTVDVAEFRQQIRHIFRAERPNDYLADSNILANLEPLVDQISGFLANNDAQNALPLLEALTDEYSETWFGYDDSDGMLGNFFNTLDKLWAEALLSTHPKQAELEHWIKRLEGWTAGAEEYGCEGLDIALQAADEGWNEPWVNAALLGETLPSLRPISADGDDLLVIRLSILEHSGHIQEALNLAAAVGKYGEQALLLLRIGRIDEAVTVGLRQFSTAKDAFALAQALRERGELEHALAIGEHGLHHNGADPDIYGDEHARTSLAAWLVDLAAGQGRVDLALYAGTEALEAIPDLGLYQRLTELAGTNWPTLRERLLAALRASKNWHVAGRIDIFLHEGLIDDAIAALGAHPNNNDLARVMDVAIAARPDWVIKAATASAEAIIYAGKAQYYDTAIEWLRRARAGYQMINRSQEWQAYLQNLRAENRRKHKLMGLMDQFERARR